MRAYLVVYILRKKIMSVEKTIGIKEVTLSLIFIILSFGPAVTSELGGMIYFYKLGAIWGISSFVLYGIYFFVLSIIFGLLINK